MYFLHSLFLASDAATKEPGASVAQAQASYLAILLLSQGARSKYLSHSCALALHTTTLQARRPQNECIKPQHYLTLLPSLYRSLSSLEPRRSGLRASARMSAASGNTSGPPAAAAAAAPPRGCMGWGESEGG